MNVIGFKEAKCKNCYKCVRTCDVKAIMVKNEQAQIMNENVFYADSAWKPVPRMQKPS